MAKKQRSGKSYKEHYSAYKTRGTYEKNRLRDLESHVKKHPEDEQASARLEQAIGDKPFVYRRGRSKNRGKNKGLPIFNKFKNKIERLNVNTIKYNKPVLTPVKTIEEQLVELGFKKRKRRSNVKTYARFSQKSK